LIVSVTVSSPLHVFAHESVHVSRIVRGRDATLVTEIEKPNIYFLYRALVAGCTTDVRSSPGEVRFDTRRPSAV
jgi:hypothetical protein